MKPREARLLARVIRIGLLVALLGQLAWSFRPGPTQAQSLADEETLGRALYQGNCSSCHGVDATGTENGPSLEGVGPASVDFQLSSGRMPLAHPGVQGQRQAPKFTHDEIAAIVAYLRPVVQGGPEIPVVDAASGDVARGSKLFLDNCAACHGAGAGGSSVGGGQIAPGLYPSTPTEIGAAIRVGPGAMPRFGDQTLTTDDVDAIAGYLLWLREDGGGGGLQLGRVGAVAEGLVAIVVGLGLIVLILRLTGSKT
jgi:ubiquinol-cytochrome c reductase cytochrome c subunit